MEKFLVTMVLSSFRGEYVFQVDKDNLDSISNRWIDGKDYEFTCEKRESAYVEMRKTRTADQIISIRNDEISAIFVEKAQ